MVFLLLSPFFSKGVFFISPIIAHFFFFPRSLVDLVAHGFFFFSQTSFFEGQRTATNPPPSFSPSRGNKGRGDDREHLPFPMTAPPSILLYF